MNYFIRMSNQHVSLLVLFFVFIYKDFFGVIIGGAENYLALAAILYVFAVFLINLILKENSVKVSSSLLVFMLLVIFLLVHFVFSMLFKPDVIGYGNVVQSFRLLFIPLLLSMVIVACPVDRRFLVKVVYLSIPLYVFSLIEFFLPLSVVEMMYNLTKEDGGAPFSNSAYFFWEFGYPIARLGSLFFSPLTFGIYTFYMIVTLSLIYKDRWYRFIVGLIGLLTLVKSFYVYLMMFFTIRNRYSGMFLLLGVVVMPLVIILLYVFFLSKGESINLMTLGPHVDGVISGVLNAFGSPLWGNGLGTSGYLNVLSYRANGLDLVAISNSLLPNLVVRGIGSESALGVMVYQLGFVYLMLFILLQVLIITKLFKVKSFSVSAVFLAGIVVFVLSESFYTLLLFVYPYALYSHVLQKK